MDLIFLKDHIIHGDWKAFFTEENLSLVKEIESKISRDSYTPSCGRVLRFLENPLFSAKVIILGQDPYPQTGVATGRAFEVGDLHSWSQSFRNISLKNILRAIYKAYTGKVLKYNELKDKFNGEFPILPPGDLFYHWEKQGVILLNTSFTCRTGTPGSHKKIWQVFTYRLLTYVNDNASKATWFLWGHSAREATGHLKMNRKIVVMHPMMCYDRPERETDFLYGKKNCFEPFISEIDWTGFGPPVQ